ncbi:mitogen-activated protein-binding protein-interacting protein [Thecamonas trahens ATCC 50062]|uniref:Mitogen-activated protein-binding protein-interacting protein n=1 Tax=Thecamonas trahens ATCC 50062 TaxID=461836 RepID=A0A0L0DN92_THETB|nr:mitogen-activated protein-binding protein-interacting protein [Thecamonas trahens ATCC 50062]KNC53779.1 mitogen-activated protein-binding protein-interacting protein [Thecamonas trahens ATCC 50062]|eukprot:XP_013754341.1 mitogen-activated protein-binding protein-interacting protein [Thecamonas trahens ATCC 50062]
MMGRCWHRQGARGSPSWWRPLRPTSGRRTRTMGRGRMRWVCSSLSVWRVTSLLLASIPIFFSASIARTTSMLAFSRQRAMSWSTTSSIRSPPLSSAQSRPSSRQPAASVLCAQSTFSPPHPPLSPRIVLLVADSASACLFPPARSTCGASRWMRLGPWTMRAHPTPCCR